MNSGEDSGTLRLTAALVRGAIAISGTSLLGMAGVEAWQVFARYVLNASPGWTEPLALLLLVTAMSFGAACGVRDAAHFGFFVVVHAAPPRLRRALDAFGQAVIALVGVLLAIASTRLFVDGLPVPMAGIALPQSAPFLPLAIGGAMIAVFALERIARPLSTEHH
jgi:TRAP-type C4-dicarboxylate transport system permease small subunit